MRILIVNNFAHVTGGADLHCLEITESLRERGHEVQWLATSSDENIETSGRFVPPSVTAGNREDLRWSAKLDVARRAVWNPDSARAMKGLSESFGPDVVHVHKAYVQLSVAPVVVASRLGIPLVQTVHDYEFVSASPLDATGSGWDSDESKVAYRTLNSVTSLVRNRVHAPRIDRWIAVSRAVAGTYSKRRGIDCTVIPNFSRSASHQVIPFSDRDGVLFLGRLSQEKGIEDLLGAVKAMPEVEFTIAGDGPMRSAVEGAARELKNLTFRGFVDQTEARDLIRRAKACLMPSLWQEPGPLACLESMAEGTPVICYPNGGLAEYVRDSNAGPVSDPSAEGLVSATSSLLTDHDSWADYSNGALNGIRTRHSRDRYLESLESVYASALESRMKV